MNVAGPSPSKSPLRRAAEQAVLDELEDTALNLRLDLEELRAATVQQRDANLAWVAQVADEVAMLLMTLVPLNAPTGGHKAAPDAGSRLGSRMSPSVAGGPIDTAAQGGIAAERATNASPPFPPGELGGVRVGLPQLHLQALRRGVETEPHAASSARSVPSRVREGEVSQTSLTGRRLVVRRLGQHTEMAPLSVTERRAAVEEALRYAAPAPVDAVVSEAAVVEKREQSPSRGRIALVTPLRHPSAASADDELGGCLPKPLKMATTTFGDFSATTPMPCGRAPASRQGLRKGKLVDPLSAKLTAAGQEDQRLLQELEATRSQTAAIAAQLGPVEFSSTMGTSKGNGGEGAATEAWVVPCGQNYREPFVADLGGLAVACHASFPGGTATGIVGSDVVVAVPTGATSTDNHQQFRSYYGRRLRNGPPSDVAFGSSAKAAAAAAVAADHSHMLPRPPQSRERPTPKLRIVMTKIG